MTEEMSKLFDEIRAYETLKVKEILNVDDVALLTGFKPSYIRNLVSAGKLPYYRPFGKSLFFKKDCR